MKLSLLVPGLFPEIPDQDIPRLPVLETLLAKGDLRFHEKPLMLEDWSESGERSPLSLTRAGALGLGGEGRSWLCADPVHFHVEGDGLLLLDSHSFVVSPEEAEALVGALNAHFSQDGLHFHQVLPTQWVVSLDWAPQATTTHPLRRVGRSIDGYLPQGPQARRWRALINEVQMLLHEHPVNLAREARGERTINGVWFWDTPMGRHDARVLDLLRGPSAYGDGPGWAQAARVVEAEHLAPLVASLRAGQLEVLDLVALEGRCTATLTLKRSHFRRFWRARHALQDLSGVPPLEHA